LRTLRDADRFQGATGLSLTELPDTTAETAARESAATVIYVCTTCRRPEDPEDYPRPGAALAAATIRAAENSGVTVTPLRCLANCKRGCSAVLRSRDAWTYVFGHLDPAADAEALVKGAQLLSQSADGLMPWRGRPDALKRGLIARVPPLDFTESET
jgi:predicted metal-binding protein